MKHHKALLGTQILELPSRKLVRELLGGERGEDWSVCVHNGLVRGTSHRNLRCLHSSGLRRRGLSWDDSIDSLLLDLIAQIHRCLEPALSSIKLLVPLDAGLVR